MIKKDKSIYLNYVNNIENKIKKLYEKVSISTLSDNFKQDIEKIKLKIFAKIFLIKNLASQETGLIPNSDWVQYQADINELYKQLENIINVYLSNSKTKTR